MPASVWDALAALIRHPIRNILFRWNRKSAALSFFFRGAIFFFATITTHRTGRIEGVAVEACYGACAAGFFGALTQAMRSCNPAWMVELFFAFILPATFQLLNFALHSALGTARFGSGLVASASFTAISALFNLFVMRRGALLIGREGKPFSHDLLVLPRLALSFVISIPRNVIQFVAGLVRRALGRGNTASTSVVSG